MLASSPSSSSSSSSSPTSPTSARTITKVNFVANLQPREPALRVRNRPPSFDFHPSQGRLMRRRRVVVHSPSPLSRQSTIFDPHTGEVVDSTALRHYNTTMSSSSATSLSTLSSSRSNDSRYSKIQRGYLEDNEYDHAGCLEIRLGRFVEGLSNALSRPSRRTPNILLTKRYYTPNNLPRAL